MENKRSGFTLAEILITIGIIGVVAAMTIKTLAANIKDKEWEASRKRGVCSIGQAFKAINTNEGFSSFSNSTEFVKGLSKYIKFQKICTYSSFYDCFVSKSKTMDGSTFNIPNNGAYFFTENGGNVTSAVLANGTTAIFFINSDCTNKTNIQNEQWFLHVCANAIFDVNGFAKPNEIGKDINFVTAIGETPISTVIVGVATDNEVNNINWTTAVKECTDKGMRLPSIDELDSISYNKTILGIGSSNWMLWSSSPYSIDPSRVWVEYVNYGTLNTNLKTQTARRLCVKD